MMIIMEKKLTKEHLWLVNAMTQVSLPTLTRLADGFGPRASPTGKPDSPLFVWVPRSLFPGIQRF